MDALRRGNAAVSPVITATRGNSIPARHSHLIMGTMKMHPRTFILIGRLRTGVDPGELAKQGSLL